MANSDGSTPDLATEFAQQGGLLYPVSYTHLTLPTKA